MGVAGGGTREGIGTLGELFTWEHVQRGTDCGVVGLISGSLSRWAPRCGGSWGAAPAQKKVLRMALLAPAECAQDMCPSKHGAS
eukprot:187714-Prorocentrum_minimum.AAC.6